jgi:hypothetical protein
MNTKQKGDLAVGRAIAHYLEHGQEVMIPIGDKRPYDLVIERGDVLQKVQCKFTAAKTPCGVFTASLRVTGGNQSFHTAKSYEEGDFDLLFVCTSDGELYEFPAEAVKGNKCSVNLGKRYDHYRLNGKVC